MSAAGLEGFDRILWGANIWLAETMQPTVANGGIFQVRSIPGKTIGAPWP